MKRICLTLAMWLAITFLLESCKKDARSEPARVTKTQTLTANQSYQLDLGNFGDEEGASISKQATNFSVSAIDREINTGKMIYNYVPKINFVGTDEVEIKSARGSDGASPNNNIVYTTIRFAISN